MLINTKAWWYKIPAIFIPSLVGHWDRPKSRCGLAWCLLFGWAIAITLAAMALWLIIVPIPAFIYEVRNDVKESSFAGLIGSIEVVGIALVCVAFLLKIAAYILTDVIGVPLLTWIEKKMKKTDEELEASKARQSERRRKIEENPGFIRFWWKSFREKTCALVHYSDIEERQETLQRAQEKWQAWISEQKILNGAEENPVPKKRRKKKPTLIV